MTENFSKKKHLLMTSISTQFKSKFATINKTSKPQHFISLAHPPTVCQNVQQSFSHESLLSLTASMQPPNQQLYACVLEHCSLHKLLFRGLQVHGHIVKTGSLLSDGFLSTKLLFMYGKCGDVRAAQQLFDEMPVRSVFAWNAVIGAYLSSGFAYNAIETYEAMRASGVILDACTLASVLKACGVIEDVHSGSEIHGLAVKCGLISNTFVVNALVAMYAKCGLFGRAWELFNGLGEEKDVVSWNSIMSACLQNGQHVEVLSLFAEMQKLGISINSYTIVGVLQACAELSFLRLGMEIHAALIKYNRKLEIYELNSLLLLYSSCGHIGEAIRVFDSIDEKDNVSLNSMLSGYAQNGLYQKAIEFSCKMLRLGFIPDKVSLISIASASARLGNLRKGMEVHAYAMKHGLDLDLQVGNSLLDMYIKCHLADYAKRIFNRMPTKDCISWTTAIAGYAQSYCYLEALELFRQVQNQGMKVDPMMLGSILQVCSALVNLSILRQVHGYAIRHELLDLVLENTIIDVYGECEQIDHALNVFDNIEIKDVVSWTSMINSFINNKLLDQAMNMFIAMQAAKIEPDLVSLISILEAIAGLSSLFKGKEIHGFLARRNISTDNSVSSSLVDMYARCGDLQSSFKVFESVRSKDLILWTAIIDATGMHGHGKEAINLFKRMQGMGLIPDHIAFLALLYACSHSGLPNEGKHYFEMMKFEYDLEPWPEHYACLVDILGRSGMVDEAFEFINSMPVAPTAAVWCALLGSCRIHLNHTLGKIAAEKLLELEPENPGNYVLISNVFAAMGKWEDVDSVRARMKERGLKKDPASSWIEVGNKLHNFVASDRSHVETVAIYSKLSEITELLEKGGYVEDTTSVLHDVEEVEKIKKLHGHSERLAIAYGLLHIPNGMPIRISKNLRVCGDCHEFTKLVSKFYAREIIVRDANRFHHFKGGCCSCKDFW